MGDTSKGVPQFATAEYAPGAPACGACKRPIGGPYFLINGVRACGDCTKTIQARIPQDSHAAFVRAVLFGIAGAIAGFALYVVFALATGLVIGFVSLAVGFIVGKAMHLGSRGVGGRRYQIVALILTYLAVSMSAVPIAIYQYRQHHAPAAQAAPVDAAPQQIPGSDTPPHEQSLGKVLGVLALLGIASPLLELKDPAHGLIGLVILFVGMRFAWRFTAGRSVNVSGPHQPATAPAGAV
jgi:hypothetical protein